MNADRARRALAVLLARAVLGFIFLMAGIYKVFDLGPVAHARNLFVEPYADSLLPAWSLWATGTVIPVVELVAGGLMLVGWRTYAAGWALGAVLVTVTFGHLVAEPLYSFSGHVFPRLVLLLVVLIAPAEWDRYSVDSLVRGDQVAESDSS